MAAWTQSHDLRRRTRWSTHKHTARTRERIHLLQESEYNSHGNMENRHHQHLTCRIQNYPITSPNKSVTDQLPISFSTLYMSSTEVLTSTLIATCADAFRTNESSQWSIVLFSGRNNHVMFTDLCDAVWVINLKWNADNVQSNPGEMHMWQFTS